MGYHYRAQVEFISFFEKGKRNLFDLSVPDILECPRVQYKKKCKCEADTDSSQSVEAEKEAADDAADDKIVWRPCPVCGESEGSYATEKPVSLLEVLVLQSTQHNERVLDCFMGSGSTGEAALRNRRRFHGIDSNPLAYELAKKRLTDLNPPAF